MSSLLKFCSSNSFCCNKLLISVGKFFFLISQMNSVFCQKAPKNAELNGPVQAQDPSNDPNIFFDPALQKSVTKGSQANTEPFGGAASDSGSSDTASSTASDANLAVDPTASCVSYQCLYPVILAI